LNLSLQSNIKLVIAIIPILCFALCAQAQDDDLSHESSAMLEVFLSSRVSLSDKVPLHYLGIACTDSTTYSVLDTLDRVLVRDLTLCGLFNLRLPNLPPDTSKSNPLMHRMTYLSGEFRADSVCSVIMNLALPFGAEPYWNNSYEFEGDRARAAAHRIAADVIRQLTGEPSVMRTRIAYVGKIDGGKEIFSATFDGFDVERHTEQGVPILSPAWSPDGRRIAYTSFLEDQADIYVIDLEDGSYYPISKGPGIDQTPDWSPDGKLIAYSSSVDGNSEIYIRDLEANNSRRLTYSWAIEYSPCWSPTGHQIAFVSDRLGRPQVFVMDADGSNQRRLSTEGDYNDSPAWSPRGDLIAYVRRDADGFQIYVTDPRGESHVKLTTGPGHNMDPCWSPDGLKIAFTSNRIGRKQVYTMDLFGRHVSRISDRNLSCASPTWSPVLEENENVKVTTRTISQ